MDTGWNDLRNVEAEAYVLGDLFSRPNDLHEISGILRMDDFSRQDFRFVYEALARMILEGKSPDPATLTEELLASGTLDKVGGIPAITNLYSLGRSYNVKELAGIVAAYGRRRRLIDKAKELATAAADMTLDIDAVTAQICDDLMVTSNPERHLWTMEESCARFQAVLERQKNGSLLRTGINSLDAYIGGLEAGRLYLVGARPGSGKTVLAGQIAVNLARKGKRILIVSMEMEQWELYMRYTSRIGGIVGDRFKRADELTDGEKAAMHKAFAVLNPLPILTDDCGGMTVADLSADARRMIQSEGGLDLLIVDHLGLLSSGRRQDSRYMEVSYISRQLKLLAKRLDVPVVACAQLSRANDRVGRPPRLSDLRDSGSLEQDADCVLLIHRPENPDEDDTANPFIVGANTKVYIAKNRAGKTGKTELQFNTAHGYFKDAEVVPMSARQSNRIDQMLA